MFVYALVKSGGKASEKRKIEIKPDGTVKIEDETVYVAGSGVMKTLLGRAGQ